MAGTALRTSISGSTRRIFTSDPQNTSVHCKVASPASTRVWRPHSHLTCSEKVNASSVSTCPLGGNTISWERRMRLEPCTETKSVGWVSQKPALASHPRPICWKPGNMAKDCHRESKWMGLTLHFCEILMRWKGDIWLIKIWAYLLSLTATKAAFVLPNPSIQKLWVNPYPSSSSLVLSVQPIGTRLIISWVQRLQRHVYISSVSHDGLVFSFCAHTPPWGQWRF